LLNWIGWGDKWTWNNSSIADAAIWDRKFWNAIAYKIDPPMVKETRMVMEKVMEKNEEGVEVEVEKEVEKTFMVPERRAEWF
jgi:hypothetical protein